MIPHVEAQLFARKHEAIGISRRHFAMSGLCAGAALLTPISASAVEAVPQPSGRKPETNSSFSSLKQIDAGLLNVAYAEAGPAAGAAVILLHGWPYDIYSFVDVAPLLASAGYRVIVPYLRGYGATRFLSNETFRNGQPSALALDTVALMDALSIPKAIVAGFDWGDALRTLWPRCGRNGARRSCP